MLEKTGKINADLSIGVDVTKAVPLNANSGICSPGVKLHGAGFIVTPEQAEALGLGTVPGLERHIRPYLNGRDFTGHSRNVMVLDFYGLTEKEVRDRFPAAWQWVYERVKPERDINNRSSYRNNWWLFGEQRKDFRPALEGLSRYIATVETAKHRIFAFLDAAVLPDNMLVNIASEDAFHLGVLSSRFHVCWALAAGGTLEDRPRYNKGVCFDTFPFPDATDAQQRRIRDLAERLDAHRRQRQAEHPDLTLTEMYNVLAALREGRPLTDREREINAEGLITVLRQLHDELDAAVAGAYGWPIDAGEQDILSRVVALNVERAAEEKRGLVRWLRPEYQNPEARQAAPQPEQAALHAAPAAPSGKKPKKLPWPREMGGQFDTIRRLLETMHGEYTVETVAGLFSRANKNRVQEILSTLRQLGFISK